jgi:hypothetical protein
MATPKSEIKTKKNTENSKRVYTKDSRPGHVIFAERADEELRLMLRRFARLEQLADSYKATPTPEQLDKMEEWIQERLQAAMIKLRESLNSPEEKTKLASKDAGFKLLQH